MVVRAWALVLGLAGLLMASSAFGQAATQPVIDFSYAGAFASEAAIPSVAAAVRVRPSGGDDTTLLQRALEETAKRAGTSAKALELGAGTYRVSGQLRIPGGVVMRGHSVDDTTVVATGVSRRALIVVGSSREATTRPAMEVVGEVPVGGREVTLAAAGELKAGDRIQIRRRSTLEWIDAMGMRTAKGPFVEMRQWWKPGAKDQVWVRTVTGVEGTRVRFDAPITAALEARFGLGTVAKIEDAPPTRMGVENLTLVSEGETGQAWDENRAWIGVQMQRAEDAWVYHVRTRGFVSSAVWVGNEARRVTVDEVECLAPGGEVGGYRRQSFWVEGTQTLVSNCTAEEGMNDFATGLNAAGPIVFLNSNALRAKGPSGPAEAFATGVLYEDVTIGGSTIRLGRDDGRAQNAGFTAGNCFVANCKTDGPVEMVSPPGFENAVLAAAPFARQLSKRVGAVAPAKAEAAGEVIEISALAKETAAPAVSKVIAIEHGRYVVGGKALWGGSTNDAWWLGQTNPATALDTGISLTRFVPGREGHGLTENLPELAEKLEADRTPFFQTGPGLWYERRRDEHSIVQRMDSLVWAPFYDLPWARSGQGQAWDGLSKYDLGAYNGWYFARQKEFATLAGEHGLVVYHNLYNTHNMLEIGAHWADYPLRPANNLTEETGIPEPPALEPHDRLHVANSVYATSRPSLKAVHRSYILKVLDELGTTPNTLFCVGYQYAGPLEFQEFFQDTAAEWEAAHGLKVKILLCTGKGLTDAILADPVRGKQVAAIDMRYWQYMPDGSLWAPAAGENKAFREMIGQKFGKGVDAPPPTTAEMIYKQVREYHDKYPGIALTAWASGHGPVPVLMAGGAQALYRNPMAGHNQGHEVDRHPLDPFIQKELAPWLAAMEPRDGLAKDPKTWVMSDGGEKQVLVYSPAGSEIAWAHPMEMRYTAVWVNPVTGEARAAAVLEPGKLIEKPDGGAWLLWLRVL